MKAEKINLKMLWGVAAVAFFVAATCLFLSGNQVLAFSMLGIGIACLFYTIKRS